MMLFDFLWDAPYAERKVDRYESESLLVSTARVNDGDRPFETGIADPHYDDGNIIVVEAYDTIEDARDGHNRWVQTMCTNPPKVLVDCRNSGLSQLVAELGGAEATMHKRQGV